MTRSYPKNSWYVAGLSHEFPKGELSGHKICGEPVVMWRSQEGEMVALDNRCCHKRFPLSEGRFREPDVLECAYHGLCYNTSGQCVHIPSQSDSPIPPQAKVRPFPVIEQDGVVWIWPGDPALCDTRKPPRTPEIGDSAWESIDSGPMAIPANFLLLIENLLDITHFYPLHDGNIGDEENSKLEIQLEEGEVDGNRFVQTLRQARGYKHPPFLQDWFHYEIVDRDHTHCMVSPGFTRVELRAAPPGELDQEEKVRGYVLMHFHTPVDETNHIWRWCVNVKANHMSKHDPSVSAGKRVAEMFPEVVAQDLWALERQQKMFEYEDDGYSELFLRPDKALRRARQIIAGMVRQEEKSTPAAAAE